jgi:hypothetical protein
MIVAFSKWIQICDAQLRDCHQATNIKPILNPNLRLKLYKIMICMAKKHNKVNNKKVYRKRKSEFKKTSSLIK